MTGAAELYLMRFHRYSPTSIFISLYVSRPGRVAPSAAGAESGVQAEGAVLVQQLEQLRQKWLVDGDRAEFVPFPAHFHKRGIKLFGPRWLREWVRSWEPNAGTSTCPYQKRSSYSTCRSPNPQSG
jgi:hypothetical protein